MTDIEKALLIVGMQVSTAEGRKAVETLKKTLQLVNTAVKLAEDWCEDQDNGLTDGEICISALKDIRRHLQ